MTIHTREEYWRLLRAMRLEEVRYDLLPDKYAVLGIGRIRKEIEAIIEKYASLTFEHILQQDHMAALLHYDDLNRGFITNVFGNLEDRALRTCDQLVDPQVVKNLSRLVVEQAAVFEQEDLPHSIRELHYENFDCSQHTRFPEKLQSLTLDIKFDSHSTLRFSAHCLKHLRRLRIHKASHCINTAIDYEPLGALSSLQSLEVFDEGITEDTRQLLYRLAISNKMRVVRIRPDNLHSLELCHFRHKKALLLAQKLSRSKAQYLSHKVKENLLRFALNI